MKCLEEPTQPAELKMFQLIQSQICQSRPRQRLPANPSQLQRGKLHLLHLFQRDRRQSAPSEKPRQMDLFEDKLLTKPACEPPPIGRCLTHTGWWSIMIICTSLISMRRMRKSSMSGRWHPFKRGSTPSQMIDPPIILSLNSSEQLKLEQYMEHFTSIGFEIEPFGGKEYAVRAVPANLFPSQNASSMEMIDDLAEGNGSGTPDLINERVATMSCRRRSRAITHYHLPKRTS